MRAGEQRLADGIVDLVRAGMVEVFALEQDLRAADFITEPPGVVDRAGAADIMRKIVIERSDKCRIDPRGVIGLAKLVQWTDQGLSNKTPAVASEMAAGIGVGVVIGDGGHVARSDIDRHLP